MPNDLYKKASDKTPFRSFIEYNPTTDDVYTAREARKDRAGVGSVRGTTPEQGYEEYVKEAARTTARRTAYEAGGYRKSKRSARR